MKQTEIITSKQFALDWKNDGVKAFILAVIAPVLLAIKDSLDAGNLDLNWKALGTTAVLTAIGYLIKNFFTTSSVQIKVTPETAELLDQKL